jgi:monolysocardiolipin acyltransferase
MSVRFAMKIIPSGLVAMCVGSYYGSYRSCVMKDGNVVSDLETDRDNVTTFERVIEKTVLWSLCYYSKMVMHVLNKTEVDEEKHAKLGELIERTRRGGRGLITVSNHVSAIDDPGVVAALMPLSTTFNTNNFRWTACATDRCFKLMSLAPFFKGGKVLPVERGAGLYQEGMNRMIAKLNRGDWVHMFPEGKRSKEKELRPFKIGVGRLVADPENIPLVVPFYHLGMTQVMDRGDKIPINIGKRVVVEIGDPIDFRSLIKSEREKGSSDREIYTKITRQIEMVMKDLQLRAVHQTAK